MKKLLVILVVMVLLLTGCEEKKKIDYSEYLFTDVVWTRDNGDDMETLIFNSNGSFSYSCACGNSLNDSDLCDGYVYNDKTKEIEFDCFEITDEMVKKIKIIELLEDSLELDFNGEIRKFKKENK